jgi:hypothetical protein
VTSAASIPSAHLHSRSALIARRSSGAIAVIAGTMSGGSSSDRRLTAASIAANAPVHPSAGSSAAIDPHRLTAAMTATSAQGRRSAASSDRSARGHLNGGLTARSVRARLIAALSVMSGHSIARDRRASSGPTIADRTRPAISADAA